MKEIRLELKVKNNLLYKEIYGKYKSASMFSKASGINMTTVCRYLTMQETPLTTRFIKGSYIACDDKYWKRSALKVADFLGCEPPDIFPVWTHYMQQTHFVKEIDSSDLLPYDENLAIENNAPDTLLMAKSKEYDFLKVLSTLLPREEAVIRYRMGFEGAKKTYDEIGKILNVTKERVRQVESKALRKLRHPARWKINDTLKEIYETHYTE